MKLPDEAVRVPAGAGWVYLRAWSYSPYKGVRRGERTVGPYSGVVVANEHGGWVRGVWDLPSREFPDLGSFEANQDAVDEYLLSLGAQVVPETEWPLGGV